MKTIGVIGGDLRQLSLAKEFKNDGFRVYTYGLTGLGEPDDNRAFSADIIVLPLPLASGDLLNMPFSNEKISVSDIIDKIPHGKTVFGGGFSVWAQSKLSTIGAKYYDVLLRPEFPTYNAVPTAEGAIEIAISETPYTLNKSKVLLTGYGNITKALSKLLAAFGADCELAIRNKKQSAEAECMGFKTFHTDDIIKHVSSYDIIFNTVPSMLFTKDILKNVKNDALIIDLASKPGGVDFEAAKELSKRVIWALSLPGKTSPVSAGAIIKKTIVNILNETEGYDYAQG